MDSFYCLMMLMTATMPCLEAYVIAFDVPNPVPPSNGVLPSNPALPSNPVPPRSPGISVVSGATSFAQNDAPTNQMPSLGGPYDLDPADFSSPSSPFANIAGTNPFLLGAPSSQAGNPAAGNGNPIAYGSLGHQADFDISDYPGGFHGPLSNTASGTVINSGHAGRGALNAAGQSNTRTDPFGSESIGTGSLNGQGFGLTGTQVNSGDSETGNPDSPFGGASSNNVFVNSLSAQRGDVHGNSRTLSQTGLNGNAFGSSSGSAMGRGEGVDLSQVANSNSQGSSPYGPGGPFSWS